MGSQVCCLTCKAEIGDQVGNVSVGALFNHATLHEMDQHNVPKKCSFSDCIGVEFNSLLEYIEHQILQHTVLMSHIVQYLGLIYVKCVSEPSDGQFYAADNPDDEVLRSRPRLNGAGYKVWSTSRSASPMLSKEI